ncbi:MAG: hypothetical protein ABFD92_00590 [Planctomycetaceae bacterium]|nr:hypothetical protein [Planctomycetaceae bacterium]
MIRQNPSLSLAATVLFSPLLLMVCGCGCPDICAPQAKATPPPVPPRADMALTFLSARGEYCRGVRSVLLRLENKGTASYTIDPYNGWPVGPSDVFFLIRPLVEGRHGDFTPLFDPTRSDTPRPYRQIVDTGGKIAIPARVVLDVPAGEYEMMAALKQDRNIHTEVIRITVLPDDEPGGRCPSPLPKKTLTEICICEDGQ